MLKRIAIVALVFTAMTVTAQAEVETFVGLAVGHTVGGADMGATVYAGTAGVLLKTFNEGNSKLYGTTIYRGTQDDGHWGGEAILATRFKKFPWLWFLVSGGALEDAFTNADGSEEVSVGFGGGIAVSTSEYTSLASYFKSYRANGEERNDEVWAGAEVHIFGL